MKKIILFVSLLFCGLTQAQTITATANGTQITEGQTFTYNQVGQVAKLKLKAINNGTTAVNIKLKMNDIENNSTPPANAEDVRVQFCFGDLCYFNVTANQTTAPAGAGKTLQPNGGSNSEQDYFFNLYQGDNPDLPVKYNMSFIQVDGSGTQVGAPIVSFNYVYDKNATAGTNDFTSLKNIGIIVNNTIIKDNLTVTTTQKAKIEVYNITGQVVKTAALQTGTQAINMTDLNAAPYIVRFTNDKNQSSQIKVVKQ